VDCIENDRRKISGTTNLKSSLSKRNRAVLVVECSGGRQVVRMDRRNVGNCRQTQTFSH